MNDSLPEVEHSLMLLNDYLETGTVASFMFFFIILAYVLFLFDIENRKQRRLGVVSFIAYFCAICFWSVKINAADLWGRGSYLSILSLAMDGLSLIAWTAGTLTLAVMIRKMAKNNKHEK